MDGQEDPLRHLKVKIEGVTRIPDTEDWVDPMANLRGVLENLTVVSMQSETNGVVLFERGEHRRIDPELNPFRAKKRGTFYLFYVIVGFTALLYLVSYLRRKGGV